MENRSKSFAITSNNQKDIDGSSGSAGTPPNHFPSSQSASNINVSPKDRESAIAERNAQQQQQLLQIQQLQKQV